RQRRLPGSHRRALSARARSREAGGGLPAMIFIYLLMALLGSAATVFALQNRDPVEISFLAWSVTGMPLALVILLSLLVGVTFASLSGLVKVLRMRYRIRQLENQVAQLIATKPVVTTPPPPPQRPSQTPRAV